MVMRTRRSLASSLALSALACASATLHSVPARAQDVPPSTSPEGATQKTGKVAPQLEEVVVTAQKRSENLQNVPIAISAVTADSAEQLGVTGTLGLQIAAPALTLIATAGGAAAVTMRGIVGTGSNGDEAPTSVYVDGVYLAGTPGLYFDLNNIERIEVLKGPQGTLFGRNSVGGSIQIITKTPEFDPQATASVEYANYDRISSQFYGTTGVTNTLAVDLAAIYSHQNEGWGTNIFTGSEIYKDKQVAVRSKILWQPDPDTNVVASGAYSRVETPVFQGRGIREGSMNIAGLSNIGFFNVDEAYGGEGFTKQKTASLNARHDFGAVTLVSITGYEDTVGDVDADFDGSRLARQNIESQAGTTSFTQEVQLLSSNSKGFDWVLGAYYFDSKMTVDQLSSAELLDNPTVFATINSESPIKSYSGFGQATIEVLPGTKLTAGLRYTLDKRSLSGFTGSQTGQVPILFRKREDDAFNYRIALSQQLTDEIMAYGSVSTGFKSGLYPLTGPSGPATAPSNLDAYEMGFKGDFFDSTLRLNVAAFLNNYDDVQVRVRLPDNTGNAFENAASVRAKGIEADFTYLASRALSFRGGLSYLDSEYEDFTNASCFFPRADGLGNTTGRCDVSGQRTQWSPEFVFSASANYAIDTSVGTITLSATESHNSGFFFDPQNRVPSNSYDLVNLSVEWKSLDEVFSARLWLRNALDERYYTSSQVTNFGDLMYVGAPSTYGLTLKASF